MDWMQFLLLIGTILGGSVYMHAEFKGWTKELKDEAKIQSGRTDKLYEMFIDLLKERKNKASK